MDKLPENPKGINPLILLELAPPEVQVIRVILRYGALNEADIRQLVAGLPEPDRITLSDLATALDHLVAAGYLTRTGNPPDQLYSIYLQHRTRKDLSSINWPVAPGNPLRPNIWTLLGGEAPVIAPPRPVAQAPRLGGLPLKSLLPLLIVMMMNTLVTGLLDVLSTSGFIETVGVGQLPWLWNVNTVLMLVSSGAFMVVANRVSRLKFLRLIIWSIAGFLGFMMFLFWLGAPAWLTYILIFVILAQIDSLFPLTFWGLANELFTMVEGKRVFPLLSAGATIGIILGYGLSAILRLVFPANEGNPILLLSLGLLMNLVSLVGLRTLKQPAGSHYEAASASPETGAPEEAAPPRLDWRENLGLIRSVPIFRYISLAIALTWLAGTMLNYYFYVQLDQATAASDAGFGPMYSLFNIATIVLTLGLQSFISGRLLSRIPIKTALVGFPVYMLAASLVMVLAPGLYPTLVSFSLMLVFYDVWDTPARQSVQNLIPDRQRSQVFTFIENYTYGIGCLIAGLVLGVLNLLVAWAGVSETTIRWIYFITGLLAAGGGVWAAFKLRATYDDSLLSWRLARPRRKSVLENLEF